MQEQLHCTNEENDLQKQCLEEKKQKLRVLKDVIIDQDNALFKEVCCENNILKQCLEEKSRN